MAYLIDRNGKGVTRPDIFAALWEDAPYDRSMQKYLDVVIRSLRDTLRDAGIEAILEVKSGYLRIRPEQLDFATKNESALPRVSVKRQNKG